MGYKLIRAVQASPVARCLASALLLVKHLGPAGPGAAPCEGWTLCFAPETFPWADAAGQYPSFANVCHLCDAPPEGGHASAG